MEKTKMISMHDLEKIEIKRINYNDEYKLFFSKFKFINAFDESVEISFSSEKSIKELFNKAFKKFGEKNG